MRSLAIICAFIFLFPSFFGCKKKEEVKQPPRRVVRRVKKKRKVVKKEKKKAEKKINFSSIKDPFVPPLPFKETRSKEEKELPSNLRFEFAQYKLKGVLFSKNSLCFFVDPKGHPLILKEGDLLGKEKVKILKITEDGVWVKEKFKDSWGREKSEKFYIKVQEKKEIRGVM